MLFVDAQEPGEPVARQEQLRGESACPLLSSVALAVGGRVDDDVQPSP
jgi:hypothetical protein